MSQAEIHQYPWAHDGQTVDAIEALDTLDTAWDIYQIACQNFATSPNKKQYVSRLEYATFDHICAFRDIATALALGETFKELEESKQVLYQFVKQENLKRVELLNGLLGRAMGHSSTGFEPLRNMGELEIEADDTESLLEAFHAVFSALLSQDTDDFKFKLYAIRSEKHLRRWSHATQLGRITLAKWGLYRKRRH